MLRIFSFCLLTCAVLSSLGCAPRSLELHRAPLSSGEEFAFVYRFSRLPLSDIGSVYFVVEAEGKERRSFLLTAGYDMYVDVRMHLHEEKDGVLVFREDRAKKRWHYDVGTGWLQELDYRLDDADPIGDKHWR
jgi:hypothetical protein